VSGQPAPDRFVQLLTQVMESAPSSENFRFGAFEFEPGARWLQRNSLNLRLEEKPFRLLALLVLRAGFEPSLVKPLLHLLGTHRTKIIGRRLNSDRLSFVQTVVFPPSHMELLPVREAKKEQAGAGTRHSPADARRQDRQLAEAQDQITALQKRKAVVQAGYSYYSGLTFPSVWEAISLGAGAAALIADAVALGIDLTSRSSRFWSNSTA
jgi:hypothetical protein